jgi:hypothetical protein
MRIWLALLVAPILALTDQSVAYAAAGWACGRNAFAIHLVHAVFFTAIAVATALAWRHWHATRETTERSATRHFLAGVATASGALSALTILAMWIPNWLLSPCFR